MRFVTSGKLKAGMIVGKTFYNKSMNIMLREGMELTEGHIKGIRRIQIDGIFIDDEETRDIYVEPVIDEKLRLAFGREVKKIYTSIKSTVQPSQDAFDEIIKLIIEQMSSNPNHIINLYELKTFDNYTFQHSIDVCILSVMIGINMRLVKSTLFDLALAAVYHDIGKMYIEPIILNKKTSLTADEFQIIKQHPKYGASHLRSKNFNYDIIGGVMQHHERFDGTGYPNALHGREISLFGRIIAIADVFGAITSKRPYNSAMLPSEAVEYIMANSNLHFDFEITKLFIDSVAAYPTGITVRLSNGLIGIVADNFTGFTLRPLVKILQGDSNAAPYYINLKDDKNAQNITITDIIQ